MDGKLRLLAAVLIPYTTVVALLYLMGYWGAFGVDVLSFARLSDVIALTIYPALGSFLLVVLAALLAFVFDSDEKIPERTAKQRQSHRKRARLILIGLSAIGLSSAAVVGEPLRWTIIAAVVTLGIAPLPFLTDAGARIVPKDSARLFAAFAAVMMLSLSFPLGRAAAIQIKKGRIETTVSLTRSPIKLVGDATHPVAYLGHVGGFFFVYETQTAAVVVIPGNQVSQWIIEYHDTGPFPRLDSLVSF